MLRLFQTLFLGVLACMMAAPAAAHAVGGDKMAFASQPLTDDALASSFATGVGPVSLRNARLSGDQYMLGLQQNLGQTSRVSLDVWFSQPGAALIDNNLLATQAVR